MAQRIADAPSQLQSSSLPAGGASCKMGQNGGYENQRSRSSRNLFIRGNGVNHHVCPPVPFLMKGSVHPYNQKSCRRQIKKHITIAQPEICGPGYTIGKYSPCHSSDASDQHGNQQPFKKIMKVCKQARFYL